MNKFRILSLKGGGLRGVGTIEILKQIEQLSGKHIYELFDLIAGTSTGGLITCACTINPNKTNPHFTLNDVMNFYIKNGKNIFPHRGIFSPLKQLFFPKYPAT